MKYVRSPSLFREGDFKCAWRRTFILKRRLSLGFSLSSRVRAGNARQRGIEEIWAELDRGDYRTNKQMVDVLKEKFGVEASVNLASRLVKRWKKAREKE